MSAPQQWTSLELLRWTTGYFREHHIPSPRLDAELLLAHALGVARIELYTLFEKPILGEERDRFRALVRDRAQKRSPVAYLTGEREFYSRSFRVTPDVLIPRSETELLVRETLALEPRSVAEVGIGSGALTCALLLEDERIEVVASDVSEAALAVAAENLATHGVESRCRLVHGAGLDPIEGTFDVVVSNPPYVRSADLLALEPEVKHEPAVALDGGKDGLDVIRVLARDAAAHLEGGWLLLEIGLDQADPVEALLREAGAVQVERTRDLAGIERVIRARFGGDA